MIEQDHDPFLSCLQSCKGKEIYVCPYRGNAGDSLIIAGVIHILRSRGLSMTADPRQAEVILWPGGNFAMYRTCVETLLDILQQSPSAEVIIGPATFRGNSTNWRNLLSNSSERIRWVFARDPVSFENLKDEVVSGGIEIGLSHDPAIHLCQSDWLRRIRLAATDEYVLVSMRDDAKFPGALGRALWWIKCLCPRRYENIMSRLMGEYGAKRNSKRVARSLLGSPRIHIEDVSKNNFEYFVDRIRRASVVHTNRLHGMILAVLLGKPVVAYPTTFRKLEDVFEHSLRSIEGVNVRFAKIP